MAKVKYAGRCDCGKISYPTKKDAKEARKRFRGKGLSVGAMAAYRCPESPLNYWHLGHMSQRIKDGVLSRDQVYGEPPEDMPDERETLQQVRDIVIRRARGRCEVCGGPGQEFSHRRTKSVHGEHRHHACNGIWSCRRCHADMHDHPERARRLGHHVSRYKEPWSEPVFLKGGWWLLHCDGTVSLTHAPEGAG